MDRSSTGEIKTTEFVGPACWIPGPTGNGVVDDGAPDEHEDYTGEHSRTVDRSTDGESRSDGGEHALVNGKKNVRYLRAAD